MALEFTPEEFAEMTTRPVGPVWRVFTNQQLALRVKVGRKLVAITLTDPRLPAWAKLLYESHPPWAFYWDGKSRLYRIIGFTRNDIDGTVVATTITYARTVDKIAVGGTQLGQLVRLKQWTIEHIVELQKSDSGGFFMDPLGFTGFQTTIEQQPTETSKK